MALAEQAGDSLDAQSTACATPARNADVTRRDRCTRPKFEIREVDLHRPGAIYLIAGRLQAEAVTAVWYLIDDAMPARADLIPQKCTAGILDTGRAALAPCPKPPRHAGTPGTCAPGTVAPVAPWHPWRRAPLAPWHLPPGTLAPRHLGTVPLGTVPLAPRHPWHSGTVPGPPGTFAPWHRGTCPPGTVISYLRKASGNPPSTGMTWPVVLALWSPASQQIALALSIGRIGRRVMVRRA